MAKTYPDIGTFSSGQILTAATMNEVGDNLDNFRVPPICIVRRTTGYTWTGTAVTWQSAATDTESPSDPMWASGSATRVTIQTNGLYLIQVHADIRTTSAFTEFTWNINKGGTTMMNARMDPGSNPRYSASWVLPLVDGDYLELAASYSGGGTVTFNGSSSTLQDQSRMTVAWIGQVS